MFKTQNLYQNDEKWKKLKLGDSNETIGGWGGLLTSVTMILNGIGYREETPATVNAKMKQSGGFLKSLLGPSYLALLWPNCVYRGMTRCEKSDAPIAQIDAAVAAGKPVILQVDSSKQAGIQAHFVLVKEKKGDDYGLYDPYKYAGDHPDQEILLTSRYKHHGATLQSEISAVLWFDFYNITLPGRPKNRAVPVPAEKYSLYVAEDFLVLRASPAADSYPRKCLMMGTELTCLEPKSMAKAKLGKQDQWIRVQDPDQEQGYVAARFVNSTRFPELVSPPEEALPTRKKWGLNNVAIENPRLESWLEGKDKDGKRTIFLLPYHQPVKSFNTLSRNSVVNVLQANQTIPGDTGSSWSGIALQETYYDSGAKKFITTRVTGWINDNDLDDYHEHPDARFREPVVDIPYATKMTTDAAQYMTLEEEDVYDPSKVKHNLCGELSVAYILGQSINQVLDKWKDRSRAIYDSRVGKVDLPLEVPHMEDLIAVHFGPMSDQKWARYKSLDVDKKLVAYKPLAFSDPDPRRTDQRRASDDFMSQLRDYYFITTVKIDLNTGDLARARSLGEGNHWIVLDKITRNGSRIELYNPFPNKRQEYTFGEFYQSMGGDPNTGWWLKREVNPTVAEQKGQIEPAFQPPVFEVAIEEGNKTPDLKDAEQYIKVEGLKKTNLCGEFCVSFVLTQSLENTLKHWMENQESLKAQRKQPKLLDLVTWLQAYGFMDGDTISSQSQTIKMFSIDRILQYWKAVQPDLFDSILRGGNNEKTGPEELKTILQAYGYKKRVDFSEGGLLASPGRTAEKLKTHFLICGVTIDGNKAGRLGGRIPHWIVLDKITPVGNLVGGNGGWVELYNPFLNRWEEYSYREFMDAYNGGGLWVARDITPSFAQQARVGAIRKGRDSKTNGQVGGKEAARKRSKPTPTQKELVQRSLNRIKGGESDRKVARALAKQLDLNVTEAARLMGSSPQEDSPSADVEALMQERLGVESVPPAVLRWIGEQLQGDGMLAQGLIEALLDFGIISVEAEKKKCNLIDFKDASLSHRIEKVLEKGIDRSNPASQQAFKVARVIGPAFTSMAIAGIKDVQARMAAEEVKKKGSRIGRVIPQEDVPVPAYRVMWDWERDDFKGSIWRPNLPCVFRCGEINDASIGHYVNLTKEWQFFWFDLCCKIYYGRYHQDLTPEEYELLGSKWSAVGSSARAFTNLHGVDKFRNHVMKKRLDSEDPKIYTLVCGGASLAGTPAEFRKGKKRMWMLKVAHFDGNRPPPPVETIDPNTDPRVFFATTIRNKTIKGKYDIQVLEEGDPACLITKEIEHGYSVNPFPQFRKDDRLLDCVVPLIATEDIYYPLKYLVPISTGSKAYPYFPRETVDGE